MLTEGSVKDEQAVFDTARTSGDIAHNIDSDIAPINNDNDIVEKVLIDRPTETPLFRQAIQLPEQYSYANAVTLKTDIGNRVQTGEFPPNLEAGLSYCWQHGDIHLKRELISIMLRYPILSRTRLNGLAPWRLENWFLAHGMDKTDDLFLLEFMPRVSSGARQALSNYFRLKYKQNLGANYFSWKRLIEGAI